PRRGLDADLPAHPAAGGHSPSICQLRPAGLPGAASVQSEKRNGGGEVAPRAPGLRHVSLVRARVGALARLDAVQPDLDGGSKHGDAQPAHTPVDPRLAHRLRAAGVRARLLDDAGRVRHPARRGGLPAPLRLARTRRRPHRFPRPAVRRRRRSQLREPQHHRAVHGALRLRLGEAARVELRHQHAADAPDGGQHIRDRHRQRDSGQGQPDPVLADGAAAAPGDAALRVAGAARDALDLVAPSPQLHDARVVGDAADWLSPVRHHDRVLRRPGLSRASRHAVWHHRRRALLRLRRAPLHLLTHEEVMHTRKLLFATLALSLSGPARADKAPSARDIMDKVTTTRKLDGSEAVIKMSVVGENGQAREREISMATKLYDGGKTEKRIYRFLSPADVQGTGILVFDYQDKPDDVWIFLP